MSDRYDLAQINYRFAVVDRRSSMIKIVTDTGEDADATNPADLRFFGMELEEARAIASKLNQQS